MAQQAIVTLMDDVDGSEAVDTVRFGLDGRAYEIDLNEAHAEGPREVLAPYLVAALRWSPRQFTEGLDPRAARGSRPRHQGGPRAGHRERPRGQRARPAQGRGRRQYRAAGP